MPLVNVIKRAGITCSMSKTFNRKKRFSYFMDCQTRLLSVLGVVATAAWLQLGYMLHQLSTAQFLLVFNFALVDTIIKRVCVRTVYCMLTVIRRSCSLDIKRVTCACVRYCDEKSIASRVCPIR